MPNNVFDLNFNKAWKNGSDLSLGDSEKSGSAIGSPDLYFNDSLVPTTDLEFVKSGEQEESIDTAVRIAARVTVLASGSVVSDEPYIGVSINAIYDINTKAIAVGSSTYDSNVDRLARHDVGSDMQNSRLAGISNLGGFENNRHLAKKMNASWQQSSLISTENKASFDTSIQIKTTVNNVFEQSTLIGTTSKQLYESLFFIAHSRQLKHEQSLLVGKSNWFGFEAMHKRQIERELKTESAKLVSYSKLYSSKSASVLAKDYGLPKEFAKLMYSSRSERFIFDPDIPLPPEKLALLDFVCKWIAPDTWLKFGATCQQEQTEPTSPKGVIFVTNSVSLVRSDDGREIKLLGFSVGIDSNSYTWSFSATVPLSELSKVDTAHEPRIGVDFECNGNLWRFILDGCDDSISFGESSLTIKGKSRAILLAHPYATQRGFKFSTTMSARQIAEAELNRNGVPSGFTLDWQLAGVNGWNVPANTYSYTGKTPINSLQWIAEAAGGFINADMSADILHVLAHYPIPSWEWAAQTPSVELPISLITSRSRGRVNKPAYNGVTIYGENDNGIGALIKRTGTSGGYQPPMVTSDLMTAQAAAISRGKMILSDTGDIGNIGISMPLVADIGVLKPSTLIGVNDGESWVGMVRGTTITGRLSSNQALEIDQSIDVERHFDKEIV